MFPREKSRETSGLEGKQNQLFPDGPYIKCFVIYLDFHLNNHIAKTNKQRRRATAQLCPGQDTFEFDLGHMTKNQPITVL